MEQKAYIVKHRDSKVRRISRSGGIFPAISDYILESSGVVYGCSVNNKFQAEHKKADSKKDRDAFRGSKYVQSNIGSSYQIAAADLESGKAVLFSGTGCQIAGLQGFLEDTDSECLYTLDIVCHGVPSPAIWTSFLQWMEKKHNGRVSEVNFRDKCYGWMAHFETVIIKGKKRVADYYRAMFYKHYSLRPCCFKCPYATIARKADITIADAWGIDNKYSYFNDDKGCSLVIINTDKGQKLFEYARDAVEYVEVDLADFMQPNLHSPSKPPKDRDQFWHDYRKYGFEYISHKYGDNDFRGNMKSLLKRFLGRTHLTKAVKKYLKI